jgi:uncharacterized protein YyaL (SSP411 family)
MLSSAYERFIPNRVLIRLTGDEKFLPKCNPLINEIKTAQQPAGYICENFGCTLPIEKSDEFERALAPAQ